MRPESGRRYPWRIWVGIVVALAGGCRAQDGLPERPSATAGAQQEVAAEPQAPGRPEGQAEPVAALPEEIVRAWKEAGAEVGWIGLAPRGLLRFFSTKEELEEFLRFLSRLPVSLRKEAEFIPAFRFRRWQEGLIQRLPAPRAPFGLDLLGTQITDAGLKELSSLENLQWLDLGLTRITDAGLKELAGLKNLQGLNLERTQITDAGVKELGSLKHLQVLRLAGTRITDAGLKELAGLKNLRELDLLGTQITDAGLKELAGLNNLQRLGLSGTRITDAGLKELQRALPNCKIFRSLFP